MKIRTVSTLVFTTAMLLLLIAALQFMRDERPYKLFSLTSASPKTIQTMNAPDKREKGETLRISILDAKTASDRQLVSNLEYALRYAKLDYQRIQTNQLASLSASPYHVLVLIGEQSDGWPYEAIRSYVQNGGRLVVTTRFQAQKWNDLVGIQENRGFINRDIHGLTFNRPLFPGYPNISSDSDLFNNSMLDVSLKPQADVYLSAEHKPLLWTYPYGQGKVVYWNASTLVDKNTRGLLVHSLGLALPAFVTGQVAAKTVYIDDFPAPWPEGKNREITKQYGLNTLDFYKQIWWKDLQSWAQAYNVSYTGLMIATYQNKDDVSSANLIDLDKETMIFFGRQLIRTGGEIGIHGYNHQSLVRAGEPTDKELGYKLWNNQAQMEKSLRTAEEVFQHYFPDEHLTSYVPPSNLIGKTGIAALQKALPTVTNVSSLYTGVQGKGYLIQEFEPDAQFPRLYHLPRITSGYRFSQETQFLQADALANFGMFSHFIHPDDVLDPSRSFGRGWPDMRQEFAHMLKQTQEYYPYLEPLTARELKEKVQAYQQSRVHVRYASDRIFISGNNILSPSHFLLRIEEGKKVGGQAMQGAELTKVQGVPGLYLIKITQPEVEIKLEEDVS